VFLALRLKTMEEPSLVFTCLWFDIYVIVLLLSLEKYNIVSCNKKEFEDLKYLLVSFSLYFLIIGLTCYLIL
jgi:hypothetical protein